MLLPDVPSSSISGQCRPRQLDLRRHQASERYGAGCDRARNGKENKLDRVAVAGSGLAVRFQPQMSLQWATKERPLNVGPALAHATSLCIVSDGGN